MCFIYVLLRVHLDRDLRFRASLEFLVQGWSVGAFYFGYLALQNLEFEFVNLRYGIYCTFQSKALDILEGLWHDGQNFCAFL